MMYKSRMSMFTEDELNQMKAGTYKGTMNPSCRILALIPDSEKLKYKSQTSEVNSALKALQQFCKVGKDKRGVNRPSNVYSQAPSLVKYIEVLRGAGLGKYFYAADMMKPTNLKNKVQNAVGNMEPMEKLFSIKNYIQYWQQASVEDKQKNNVSNTDIEKLNKLYPVVNELTSGQSLPNISSYNNSKWYPIVENIWNNIPSSSTNNSAPPAVNNSSPPAVNNSSPSMLNTIQGFFTSNKKNNSTPKTVSNNTNVVTQLQNIKTKLQTLVKNMNTIAKGGTRKQRKQRKRRSTYRKK
jgi:hypothetical protein